MCVNHYSQLLSALLVGRYATDGPPPSQRAKKGFNCAVVWVTGFPFLYIGHSCDRDPGALGEVGSGPPTIGYVVAQELYDGVGVGPSVAGVPVEMR